MVHTYQFITTSSREPSCPTTQNQILQIDFPTMLHQLKTPKLKHSPNHQNLHFPLANLTLLTQPPPPFSDQGTRRRFQAISQSVHQIVPRLFFSTARSSQASRGSKRGVAVPKGGKIGCYPTRVCHGNSPFGGRNDLVYPRFAVQLDAGWGNVLNSS